MFSPFREQVLPLIDPGDTPEPEVDRLILWATGAVRNHLRSAVYPVDGNGIPTNPEHRQAVVQAIAAQCSTVLGLGLVSDVLSGGAGAEPTVQSTSDNGASISFSDAHTQAARVWLRRGALTTEARLILESAGLYPQHPSIAY